MPPSALRWFAGFILPVACIAGALHIDRQRDRGPAGRPPPEPIAVTVDGAVRRPGPLNLPHGASLADTIRLAGGLAPGAQADRLSLDRPVSDGEIVFVPGEADAVWTVSINHATTLELDHLPGIGPALAARIQSGRPYARVEDLIDVPGIGPATLKKLLPHITP